MDTASLVEEMIRLPAGQAAARRAAARAASAHGVASGRVGKSLWTPDDADSDSSAGGSDSAAGLVGSPTRMLRSTGGAGSPARSLRRRLVNRGPPGRILKGLATLSLFGGSDESPAELDGARLQSAASFPGPRGRQAQSLGCFSGGPQLMVCASPEGGVQQPGERMEYRPLGNHCEDPRHQIGGVNAMDGMANEAAPPSPALAVAQGSRHADPAHDEELE